MEGRIIECHRPGGGLDYHNSPLIGEIPTNDYSHYHRSIDQLRSIGMVNGASGGGGLANGSSNNNNNNNSISYHPHLQHPPYSESSYPNSTRSQETDICEMMGGSGRTTTTQHISANSTSSSNNNNNNNNNNSSSSGSSSSSNERLETESGTLKHFHKKDQKLYNGHNQHHHSNNHHHGHQQGHHHQSHHNHSSHNNLRTTTPSPLTAPIHPQLTSSSSSSSILSPPPSLSQPTTTITPPPPPLTTSYTAAITTHHPSSSTAHTVTTRLSVDGPTKEPKIFSSKADLQLHTQIHMREAKPYKCSQCAKAFANSSYLSQHTRIHLGIKPYRCEICQRKFTQLSHLQQHIRTHTGDKPYKCRHPGCQKAFSQLSNLQSHSRCHQTDKPYKCNSCYKCFSDEPSLLEHIPKHKESKHLKTHICQYCGKSYTQETYLTKHMQKHAERTDKRPPIGVGGSGTTSVATNRNITLPTNAQLPGMTTDHPYWPKVSPDSAANLTDVMHQQQQQHHQPHAEFTIQHQNGHTELQPHHRGIIDHQQRGEENGEDLVISRQNSANGQTINGQNLSLPPSSTPMSSAGNYEVITKTTTNSAFTPINTMPPHLNTLGHHHQLSRQPYLYDAISFPNKNMVQNTTNSFPNQLISLHQIRNYAHQPSGLMAGEHLLGVSVGAGGKDKG